MIDKTPLDLVLETNECYEASDGLKLSGSGRTKTHIGAVPAGTSVFFTYTASRLLYLYDWQSTFEIACRQLPEGERPPGLFDSFMHIEDVLEECPEYFIAQGKTKINIGEVLAGTNCTMAIVFNKSIIQLNDIDTGDLLAEVKIKLILA